MSPDVLAACALVAVLGLAALGAGFVLRPGPISRKLRDDRVREGRDAIDADASTVARDPLEALF